MIKTEYLVGVTDVFAGVNFITKARGQEELGRLVLSLGKRFVLNSVTIMPNYVDYDSLIQEMQSSQDDGINFGNEL
ncbi:MAG: hypothetical protein ACTSPD_10240 [Promethearchaeota archaeon]